MSFSSVMRNRWILLAAFAALCLGVSGIIGSATAESVDGWYATLRKPSFNPPDWLFGPVWTVLYLGIAVAGWRIWRSPASPQRSAALVLYFSQLALNFAWSMLFFGARQIGLALIDVLLMLALILVCVRLFHGIDRLSAWLFVPYTAWVGFATVLNASIWWLNR